MGNYRRKLSKASRYRSKNRHLFRTPAAFRKHLDRRRENGLLSSGAVIESPLGLLIDEERFAVWLTSKADAPDASSMSGLDIAA